MKIDKKLISQERMDHMFFATRTGNALASINFSICKEIGLDFGLMLSLLENNYQFDGMQDDLILLSSELLCRINPREFASKFPIWDIEYSLELINSLHNLHLIEIFGKIENEEILYISR